MTKGNAMSNTASADNAIDGSRPIGRGLGELMESARLFNCFRICLASAICVIISTLFRLPLCFESIIGVLVLMINYTGQVSHKGAERIFGRLFGAIVGLGLAHVLFDIKPVFLMAMVGVLLWTMYRMAQGKLPYAISNGGFTAATVMIIATVSAPEAQSFAFHWVLQVCIGALVAMVIDRLIPYRADTILNTGLGEIFHSAAETLEAGHTRFGKTIDRHTGSAPFSGDSFSHVLKLVDGLKTPRDDQALHEQYLSLFAHAKILVDKIGFLRSRSRDPSLKGLNEDAIRAVTESLGLLATHCREIGNAITRSGTLPRESSDLQERIESLERIYATMRKIQWADNEERERSKSFATLVASVKGAALELEQARDVYSSLVSVKDIHKAPEESSARAASPAPSSQVSIASLQKSIMITSTLMLVYGSLIWLNLPGGEPALVAGLIVAIPANLGKSMSKWKLRCLGAFSGAVYGLVAITLVAYLPFFPILLLLVVLGIFLASYVALGSETLSYAGLQAGIALALVLVYAPGPPVSLDPGVARFCGAIFGGIAATVVQYLLWPSDPLEKLRRHLTIVMEHCGTHFRSITGLTTDQDSPVRPLSDLGTVGMEQSRAMLGDARHMIDASKRGLDLYQRLIAALDDVLATLVLLERSTNLASPHKATEALLSDTRKAIIGIASVIESLRDRLAATEETTPITDLGSVRAEYELLLESLRESGKLMVLDAPGVAGMGLVNDTLMRLMESLGRARDAIDSLCLFEAEGKLGRS